MKHKAMSSRLMPLVASCATVGMLLAGLPASAVAVGTTRAAASDASSSTTATITPSADTTLQAWASEKNEKKNTAAYVGALQPEGDYGDFGEKFKSTDVSDVTDAKMGLMTFDLSDYTAAPEHSILTLTYLGYAGADKTATATG